MRITSRAIAMPTNTTNRRERPDLAGRDGPYGGGPESLAACVILVTMESDPATRRREAVIAGHLGDEQLAWTALADPDPKTRASAIGALNRMGMIGAKELEPLLKDPSSEVRKRACQIAPRLPRDASRKGDRPKVASILQDTLSDEDPLVAEMACWALGE